jgi:endonuclease/exonuclease/phosphatase family metal-dependent hydrolase
MQAAQFFSAIGKETEAVARLIVLPKGERRWRLRYVLRYLLLKFPIDLYLGVMALYFAVRSMHLDTDDIIPGVQSPWPVELISTFLFWALIPAFAILIAMLVLRRWRRAVFAALLCGAFIWVYAAFFTPRLAADEACTPDNCLTVMTYNIAGGLAPTADVITMLRGSGADIIGLQEVTQEQSQMLYEQLRDVYPHQAINTGPMLISKYPITSVSVVDPVWEHLWVFMRVTLDVNGRAVTVVITRQHPPRPERTGKLIPVTYRTWNPGRNVARLVVDGEPTLMLMDFNATDQNHEFGYLAAKGLRDAFREAGSGPGFTYPAHAGGWHEVPDFIPPLVRIDYILMTDDFTAQRAWVGQHVGSDHLPVFAQIRWSD